MINQFYGFKIDQQQTFNNEDKRLVVTKIKVEPLEVKRVKNEAKDGYWALQVKVGKFLRELRLNEELKIKPGEKINPGSVFKKADRVQVKGITKGRGFAGVVKRWGFHGGPKTHGQSDRARAPGSIGQGTSPGRVWKGKKMPGHMGNKPKTIKGLKVFKIDEDKGELWLAGVVPGNKGGLLKISKIG